MSNYERFQLQWMADHNHSIRELIDGLTELQYDDPEDSDKISTPVRELYEEWEKDRGFGQELWPCEAEYCETEAVLPLANSQPLYYLLYAENSDCGNPAHMANVRHFASLKDAKNTMKQAYEATINIIGTQPEDDEHCTTITDREICIQNGCDTYRWTIGEAAIS